MKNSILNHNFGYGINDKNLINKIILRNDKDLEIYIQYLIEDTMYAKVKDNVITLISDNSKIKLFIEEH